MNIQPLEQGNLSARAYIALREGLITGKFRPGQRLVMQDLAEMLGTSVTPVREACLRLVSERGLELRSGRFVTVPALTLARYKEVRTIRLALEGLATKLAAENATEEDVRRIANIHETFEAADQASDAEAFLYKRDFHFAVYRLTGMEVLVSHIESLWVSMGPMLTVLFKDGARKYICTAEHGNVIAALREKNGTKARAAMERALVFGGEDFLRVLKTR